MDYFIDIRILPNAEYSDSILMNEIFFRLHKVLVEMGPGEVGFSFPLVKKTLGCCLRLHGSQLSLQILTSKVWSKGIEDLIEVSDIEKVPEVKGYRVVNRVQVKSSVERLMRRSVRKGWITQDEANKRIGEKEIKTTSLPYIRLKSLSTNQKFCLFIKHGPILPEPVKGQFNAYGLSATATVPWF